MFVDTADWTTSRLLNTAARLSVQQENQHLTKLGVTHTGATTLKVLADSGPVSQKGLADLVHVKAQTMGKVLERLELKGLIYRIRNVLDGRCMHIRLTAQGQAVVRNIDHLRGAAGQSTSPADRVFRDQLITIIARLGPAPI